MEKLLRKNIKTNRFNESNFDIFNKYLMLKIFNILNYILKKLTKFILKELIRKSIKPGKFNESR
jgi:hypothetical protein